MGRKTARGRGGRTDDKRRTLGRLAIAGMILGAGYFALFGGEYSVFELTRLRALEQDEAAELGRTEQRIDSLAALAAKLTGDSATIERVAREQYGMIRKGEILYRFHEPGREGDSSAVPAVGEDTAAGSGGTR